MPTATAVTPRDYRAAAAQGYRFLLEHFRDPEHGGYYWLTDRSGRPLDRRKFLYGQTFVIYALVEYYRASGVRAALDHAVELYRTVHEADPRPRERRLDRADRRRRGRWHRASRARSDPA